MKSFNFKPLWIALIAGLLLGVLLAHPIPATVAGLVVGGILGFAIRPKKKSCCH